MIFGFEGVSNFLVDFVGLIVKGSSLLCIELFVIKVVYVSIGKLVENCEGIFVFLCVRV